MPSLDDRYLVRRKHSGNWWLKYPIPAEYRYLFPTTVDGKATGTPTGNLKRHIEESLGTADVAEAIRKKRERLYHWDTKFRQLAEASDAQSTLDPDLAGAFAIRELFGNDQPTEAERDILADRAEDLQHRIGGRAGEAKAQTFHKIASGRQTLREAFASQCKDAERRRSTDEKYGHALSLLLAFIGKSNALPEDITPDTALRFVDHLNHSAKTKRGPLAFQTKKNMVAGLSSLWTHLEHRRQIPRGVNPWQRHQITGKPKPHDAPKADAKRPWTDEEIIKLARGPEIRDSEQTTRDKRTLMQLFVLAFYTGARLDEVCARRVMDVEKIRGGYVMKITEAKRGASIRNLPITNPIPVAILAERIKGRAPDAVLFPEFPESGYDNKRGKAAVKACYYYRRKLGLVGATDTHGARRTLLSLLERKGAHPVWAQRYAGHKPMDMTHGTYAQGAASSLMGIARLIAYPKRVEQAFRDALVPG